MVKENIANTNPACLKVLYNFKIRLISFQADLGGLWAELKHTQNVYEKNIMRKDTY